MRIGITGAKGFIGKHLVSALKKRGTVVTLPHRKGLSGKRELKQFVTDIDLFFHLGGVNRGTDEEILNGNIIGTARLLESILNNGKSSARLVFASSAQVYPLVNCKTPIRETKKANPDTVYGVSKQNAESLIRISGIPFTVLRLSNVYGPGCRPNYNSVVATLCYMAVRGFPLVINGDGRQGRDFVYIEDVIQANIKACGCTSVIPEVFNVGTGKSRSFQDIADILQKELGTDLGTEYFPNPYNGYQMNTQADIIRTDDGEWGFEPKFSLEEGIKAYIPEIKRLYGEDYS